MYSSFPDQFSLLGWCAHSRSEFDCWARKARIRCNSSFFTWSGTSAENETNTYFCIGPVLVFATITGNYFLCMGWSSKL